jgi:hypothetical protein
MPLNLLHLTTPPLPNQHRDLREAHNRVLNAHRLVHASLDAIPASVDGIITSLKGLALTRQDLEHRAQMLSEQVNVLRAALMHAQQQYDAVQESLTAYTAIYGIDDRVAPVIETATAAWRTLGYIGRSMVGYQVRVVSHAHACALLATRL